MGCSLGTIAEPREQEEMLLALVGGIFLIQRNVASNSACATNWE